MSQRESEILEFLARGASDKDLGQREGEILQLVTKGLSGQEIANTLSISENTVRSHLRSILHKLRLASSQSAGYITVDVVVTKEGSQFSSWCPSLDIASCGDTCEAATQNLSDAIELYLNTLEEEGELERVFQEKGVQVLSGDEPAVPGSFVTQYRHKLPV